MWWQRTQTLCFKDGLKYWKKIVFAFIFTVSQRHRMLCRLLSQLSYAKTGWSSVFGSERTTRLYFICLFKNRIYFQWMALWLTIKLFK
jgi:hypothetical protein